MYPQALVRETTKLPHLLAVFPCPSMAFLPVWPDCAKLDETNATILTASHHRDALVLYNLSLYKATNIAENRTL